MSVYLYTSKQHYRILNVEANNIIHIFSIKSDIICKTVKTVPVFSLDFFVVVIAVLENIATFLQKEDLYVNM